MKLMKRDTETTYVPDCFVEAYKTLGYSVVGEEEPSPTVPPPDEQDVPEDKKETEFVCPVCGKNYSRKANLDRHIADKHS